MLNDGPRPATVGFGIDTRPIDDPTVPHGLEPSTRLWLMDRAADAVVDVRDQLKRSRRG
jgi:hypothetical protein